MPIRIEAVENKSTIFEKEFTGDETKDAITSVELVFDALAPKQEEESVDVTDSEEDTSTESEK